LSLQCRERRLWYQQRRLRNYLFLNNFISKASAGGAEAYSTTPAPHMQLDLFLDGRDVVLQNGVIAALRERDVQAGGHALAAMTAEYPDHALRNPMEVLLRMLAQPAVRYASHSDAADARHEMDTLVVPAARSVFGDKDANTWLAPLWRLLASGVAHLSFDPAHPRTHAAALLLQCSDGAAAETAVAGIPSWRRIPQPLAWMAQARFYQSGMESAWPLLMELAWIDASLFTATVQHITEPLLHKLVKDFDAAFEDEGAPNRAWFPAWLLVTVPALAWAIPQTQVCGSTAPERTARLVAELLALEKQGRHADLVARRKRLRDAHAALYTLYMSSR
jgi:hypothetical protein